MSNCKMTLFFWQKGFSEAGGGMTDICTCVYHTVDFNSFNFSFTAHVSDNSSTNIKNKKDISAFIMYYVMAT